MKFTKFDKYIGNKLFEKRVPRRITQEQMADMISTKLGKNIPRTSYASYEQGVRSMPRNVFEIACDILGLDWREVFNEALENCKEK